MHQEGSAPGQPVSPPQGNPAFIALLERVQAGHFVDACDYKQLMSLIKFLVEKKLVTCEEAAALSAAAHELRTGPYLTRVKPPAR